MKELYELILHSQLGPRRGRLSLLLEGASVTGVLSLAGNDNPVRGGWDASGALVLTHTLRTVMGEHPCRSVLTFSGDDVSGDARLAGCTLRWSGRRVSQEETEESRFE